MPRRGKDKRVDRAKPAKRASSQSGLSDIYADMLADTVSTSTYVIDEGRSTKKRRIAGRMVSQDPDEARHFPSAQSSDVPDQMVVNSLGAGLTSARQQMAYNESEDSAESDMDWEEVDLEHTSVKENSPERDDEPKGELNLVLGHKDDEMRRWTPTKRKPMTKAEKQVRLEIHKMHLLSLLFHVHLRNHWCNDKEVHVGYNHIFFDAQGLVSTGGIKELALEPYQILFKSGRNQISVSEKPFLH